MNDAGPASILIALDFLIILFRNRVWLMLIWKAICLDRHISDHRPILLLEVHLDFGPNSFRFYHSWFDYVGFDDLIKSSWLSFSYSDGNGMIRFKKKLQDLKVIIRHWIKGKRSQQLGSKNKIVAELGDIDRDMDRRVVNDDNVLRRFNLKRDLLQVSEAVWDCGDIKSPGPDGFSFEFFKKYWDLIGPDFCGAVRKNKQAMFFKVDFAKAYDSVRWDYLFEVLEAFRFGQTWCKWIQGILRSGRASILVNGSPSKEFSCHRGLKQGDPLVPYFFILVMESLHMSFTRAVADRLFKGIILPNALSISHLFYADDVMFLGKWSDGNLHSIINILKCFYLASGVQINISKCQLLGVGVSNIVTEHVVASIGCSILNDQFRYLEVMVGQLSSRLRAWDDIILKLRARLSKWKVKTLSIGGRLTLLKSVLEASLIYNMSIYKVPRGVLKEMEGIRSRFFNGVEGLDKKITWVAWNMVLASKK
nr:RNA-directed DNA polymerase, eukaryota [Tanacetum cinerariifolium]